MSDRVTLDDLRAVTHNLNHRILVAGVKHRQVIWEQRNGGFAADEFDPASPFTRTRTLVVGTKREVYDALWNMIRGIDMLSA